MATRELLAQPAPISTRVLGDFEVSLLRVADIRNWKGRFSNGEPFTLANGESAGDRPVSIASSAMLIRGRERVVIVDPNEWPTAHTSPSGVEFVSRGGLDATLGALGIHPSDVTDVVFTHLHRDHFHGLGRAGGGVRFLNGRHYVPQADWDAYYLQDRDGYAADIERDLGPVARAGLAAFVAGDLEIAPGITLLSTPGESPGHVVLRLETGAAAVYYVGDLIHFPIELEHVHLMLHDRDPIKNAASRKRVCRDAVDRNGLVVYTHADFPGWGVIERTGESSWRWRSLQTPAA